MGRFRKKPIIIEAEQFVMSNDMISEFAAGHPVLFMEYEVKHDVKTSDDDPYIRGYYLEIPTFEGLHKCVENDWVLTGIKGERYSCRPDIFEATYEPVP